MKSTTNRTQKDGIVSLTAGLIVGSIVTLVTVAVFLSIDMETIEHIIKIIAYPFIAGSAIVAVMKYRQDNKWNKKHLAYEKILVYVKELEEYRMEIDKAVIKTKAIERDGKIISFTDRRRIKEPLDYKEVHRWVCKDHNVADDSDMCSMTEDGVSIVRNLLSIINTYEMIAIGVKDDMLDRELVRTSMESVIVKNFEFFKRYIIHRREKHEDFSLGVEWEKLYEELVG